MYEKLKYSDNKILFKKKLNHFLNENKKITLSFRYYNKRTFEVLENHIYTSLYFKDNECVGYGHLDKEEDKIWLGIAVNENKINLGIGSYIMDDLLNQYDGDIFLTVDINNLPAIKLYNKKKFNILHKNNKYFLMKK